MFEAYSLKTHSVISIQDAFDMNEVYCCPNLDCPARFTIRSVTGKRAKHFARLPSTQHKKGCIFDTLDERYLQPDKLIKSSLEEIYAISSSTKQSSLQQLKNTSSKHGESGDALYIHTPKQLFDFCNINSLTTEYLPGIKVDDIILDSRNLISKGRFRGIEGLRIVVGETVDWESWDKLFLKLSTLSVNGKRVTLHITVKVGNELASYVRKYIVATNKDYAGYPIAILGNWKIDKQYYISCVVKSRKHILLKK